MPRVEIALNFPWLNWTFIPENQKRIDAIIEKHRPDILHLHNHMFDLAFSAVRIRHRYRIPLAVTIHTIIKHTRDIYNVLLYPADRILLRKIVIEHSDLVICPDYNVKTYVEEAFRAKNHIIIPYGIDRLKPPLPDKTDNIINKFGLKGKRVILSLGHVHDLRNRIDLIKAMPAILAKVPNALLLIVGAVTTDTPVQKANELGVQRAVVFSGAVPHDDISAFLSLADIEAHWLNQDKPGVTSLGIASLESMSFGKPIIAIANVDSYGKGVLQNGENCIIAKSNDSMYLAEIIIDLLENRDKRERIGFEAYKTIKNHFAWESVCKQSLNAYGKMIANYSKI
jgi:glycosyltransferase involved in cell wall biosynthesis